MCWSVNILDRGTCQVRVQPNDIAKGNCQRDKLKLLRNLLILEGVGYKSIDYQIDESLSHF